MQISGLDAYLQRVQRSWSKNYPSFPGDAGATDPKAATSASGETSHQVNFTNMSRNDLRGWIHEQARAGKLSARDAWSLGLMTMSIPADFSSLGANMDKPVNFEEMAREGIKFAHQHHDATTEEMLQSVLKMMTSR